MSKNVLTQDGLYNHVWNTQTLFEQVKAAFDKGDSSLETKERIVKNAIASYVKEYKLECKAMQCPVMRNCIKVIDELRGYFEVEKAIDEQSKLEREEIEKDESNID